MAKNFHLETDEYEGLLLLGVKGSLAQERLKSSPKDHNRLLRKLRLIEKKTRIQFFELLKEPPGFLEKRMAYNAALFPETSIQMKLKGKSSILGKNQYKKIKNIILFIDYRFSGWLRFILLEEFFSLIPKGPAEGIKAELQFLRLILELPEEQKKELLEKIYSEHNLEKQRKTGEFYLSSPKFYLSFFDITLIPQKVRRRGYNDKGKGTPLHEKERRKAMRSIEEELDLTRKRILRKQMELFEQNLDKLLAIGPETDRSVIKQIIQSQNEELSDNIKSMIGEGEKL